MGTRKYLRFVGYTRHLPMRIEINQITAIQIPRRIKFSPPVAIATASSSKKRRPQPREEESIATTGKQKAEKSMTTDAAGQEEEKAQKTGKNQAQRTREGGGGKKMKDRMKKRKEVALDEGPESQPQRWRTADGRTVYSAAELGWGNPDAGGTPLCPVDCSCCF